MDGGEIVVGSQPGAGAVPPLVLDQARRGYDVGVGRGLVGPGASLQCCG